MNSIVATVIAWFIYFLAGMIPALLNNEQFDPKKIAKSILWAIIVMIIALWLQLPPEIVITEQASLIEQVVLIIESVGGLSFLMYIINKIYETINGARNKLEAMYGVPTT